MRRILIVHYSRTGNTRRVAEAIARKCGADIEEIRDVRSRGGLWGWLRSGREAWVAGVPEIGSMDRDPAAYDLVVLGSPVWAGHVSSPMRRYLQDHAGKFGAIALFVTEGGSGGQRAISDMARLAGHTPVATLEITERQLKNALDARLADFVDRINTAASSRQATADQT